MFAARTAAFALLVALTLAPARAETRAGWPANELLVRQFERIAFSSEFGGPHRHGRMIRWQGPIVVRLTGTVAAGFRAEVETQRGLGQLDDLLDYFDRRRGGASLSGPAGRRTRGRPVSG